MSYIYWDSGATKLLQRAPPETTTFVVPKFVKIYLQRHLSVKQQKSS